MKSIKTIIVNNKIKSFSDFGLIILKDRNIGIFYDDSLVIYNNENFEQEIKYLFPNKIYLNRGFIQLSDSIFCTSNEILKIINKKFKSIQTLDDDIRKILKLNNNIITLRENSIIKIYQFKEEKLFLTTTIIMPYNYNIYGIKDYTYYYPQIFLLNNEKILYYDINGKKEDSLKIIEIKNCSVVKKLMNKNKNFEKIYPFSDRNFIEYKNFLFLCSQKKKYIFDMLNWNLIIKTKFVNIEGIFKFKENILLLIYEEKDLCLNEYEFKNNNIIFKRKLYSKIKSIKDIIQFDNEKAIIIYLDKITIVT